MITHPLHASTHTGTPRPLLTCTQNRENNKQRTSAHAVHLIQQRVPVEVFGFLIHTGTSWLPLQPMERFLQHVTELRIRTMPKLRFPRRREPTSRRRCGGSTRKVLRQKTCACSAGDSQPANHWLLWLGLRKKWPLALLLSISACLLLSLPPLLHILPVVAPLWSVEAIRHLLALAVHQPLPLSSSSRPTLLSPTDNRTTTDWRVETVVRSRLWKFWDSL